MGDLTPIAPKLGRLLPRLSSDADGEVVATVRAISRTLSASGCDWHDLAAQLSSPAPQARPDIATRWRTDADATSLLGMAAWLRAHAEPRLTSKARDFVAKAANLLALGRTLTPKQAKWLRDLYAAHRGGWA